MGLFFFVEALKEGPRLNILQWRGEEEDSGAKPG